MYTFHSTMCYEKKELRSSDLCHTETNMKKNAHKYMRKICSLMHNTMLYYWLTGAMIIVLGSVCSVFCFTTFISIIVQFTSTLSKKMIQCCRVSVWLKSLFFVSVFFLLCKHWFGVIIMVFINVYNIHKSNKIVINYLNGI